MSLAYLRTESITKAYDQHVAVREVSLSVPEGVIYGLLGPNGAGKTSLIRMITSITAPDSGQIFIGGELLSPTHIALIGYLPEERGLYKKMKVREQLEYLLELKGMSRAAARSTTADWLKRLQLSDWQNRNTSDLSKGMQQKVQFIATVAHQPRLLILDEPFSGLDPVNSRIIEGEILRMKQEGVTIIFSTHRLEQVETFCDHIGLINKGQIILQNDIGSVRSQYRRNEYRLEFSGDGRVLEGLPGIAAAERKEQSALLRPQPGLSSRDLLRLLAELPLDILRFEQATPRITDIFIELVGAHTPEAALVSQPEA
jgi:ABC-2 type transport system ATP-binding protein